MAYSDESLWVIQVLQCWVLNSNEQVSTECTLNAIRSQQTSSMYLSITIRLYFASVLWQNVSSVKFIMSFVAQKMTYKFRVNSQSFFPASVTALALLEDYYNVLQYKKQRNTEVAHALSQK